MHKYIIHYILYKYQLYIHVHVYIEIYAAKRICHCDAAKGWGPVICSPNSYEFAYALVCTLSHAQYLCMVCIIIYL